MEVIRAAQALFVLWIGLFAALVALNNVVDYGARRHSCFTLRSHWCS